MIDLRSDTVTRPGAAMRRAIHDAEVGDDVYGEDPTTSRLERIVADILGKESAVFVPSGTMANQLAVKVHTTPGDEILLERSSHILNDELGASGLLSGVHVQTLDGDRGVLSVAQVTAAIHRGNLEPRTRLLCLENTLNRAGGRVYPQDRAERIVAEAKAHGLRTHLDGARIWHAAVATGRAEADLVREFDTVSVCLSKGLGAPIGSLLAGAAETIVEARRYRKMFGGGMRQAGILAAAGLYALDHHLERLADDHANAVHLAAGLEQQGFPVEGTPDTNIVMFGARAAADFSAACQERGLLINPMGEGRLRAVTHLDVAAADIDEALARIAEVARAGIR